MNPGQAPLCRDCRNFHRTSWDQGHPNPCGLAGWTAAKHTAPGLSPDGQHCEGYDGPELVAADSGTPRQIAAAT